ncbi:putative F-box protein At3g10240 [Silene latifolia]|uniref:putative F-box protein At3g10240 n=1 Tax=Silene latifolia TaxID=37657 RepID=UPI003D788B8E
MEINTSDASNADIPEEILIDQILSRLSSKSFSRFKCVSKHWNDTLTITAFLLKHSRSYDKHPKHGFVARTSLWSKNSVISIELNDDNTPKTTGSLIRGQDTRDFINLPAITIEFVDRFWFALGFDPVHKVFKVLCLAYGSTSKECTTTKAAILTVGSKYWNPIESESESLPYWLSIDSIFLDGVIYCVHIYRIANGDVVTITAFDFTREVFRDYELVMTPRRRSEFRYYLTSLKECPTLFIWKIGSDYTEEVEQWTLFNHKDPNATWNRRIFTNHNFPRMVPYDYFHGTTTAGRCTLLQYSETINSECSWYLLHDLENFAIE